MTRTAPCSRQRRFFDRAALAALLASGVLAGCVAVAGGAIVGGAVVATDRRSAGTQLDDQTIDLRAASAVGTAIGDRGHVTATSYNRVVMLTGEVPTEADRNAAEVAVRRVENVRAVLNELAVMPSTTMSERSSDSVITGKVKAAFLDKGVGSASIKVVTERGIVYLMGIVTAGESETAGNVARGVGGVRKVIKVFEIVTPTEIAAMPMVPPPAAASAPAPPK